MQKTTSIAILLLASATLSSCVSSIKPETKPLDFYDFGLQSSEHRVDFSLPIERLNAHDAIQHGNIRYRLNYQNPTQVFSYAESRWSTLPLDLLRQKIGNVAAGNATCSLKLHLLAFDQVFASADSSQGIVQLQASLIDRRTRKSVSSTLLSAESPASSADAKGGVAALNAASTTALQQAAQWASESSANASECQPTAN